MLLLNSLNVCWPYMLLMVISLLGACNIHNQKKADKTNATSVSTTAPALPPNGFRSETALVNGVHIHYVVGGKGYPLVLIHGFGENWFTWNRLLPKFAKHFTVIVPDLRGVGESGKPAGGYDKKTMAADIHELVKKLGYKEINLAGHDIGLMVAYAYAAQYSNEVRRLALIEAIIPGIEPYWSQVSAKAWWWGFFSWSASPQLIKGREREFLTNFQNDHMQVKNAFTVEETNEIVRSYTVPGAITSSFQWFATFPKDAVDNIEFAKHKLDMPVLSMGGEYAAGLGLAGQVKMVAIHVQASEIKGAKHWLVQEKTTQVQNELLDFFMH